MTYKYRQRINFTHKKQITMEQEKTLEEKYEKLRESAIPLIKYLCENHHPHVTAIVTSTGIELMEGISTIITTDYLID